MNNPEATAQALEILRSGTTFQWYVIPMLALVIYSNEYAQRNCKPIAGLALYGVHWFYEITGSSSTSPAMRCGPCRRGPRSCCWSGWGWS